VHQGVVVGQVRLRTLILLFVAVLAAPRPSRADWVVAPFVGVAFGGAVTDPPRIPYGASVGWMGDGMWGFEVEVSDQPNFFATADVPDVLFGGSSGVTTVMVNGIFGLPSGGWERLRPYLVGGAGLFRSEIGNEDSFIRGRSNNVGFNAGGGATVSISEALGLRGDVRYFRDAQDFEGQSEFFHLGASAIDFWRAAVGVTFRF